MTGDMVTLKDGSSQLRVAVTAVMINLRELSAMDPIALSELRDLARDPEHQLWGSTEARLAERKLVTRNGTGQPVVHGTIRAVVLSAVTGEDMELRFGSPYAEEGSGG
jgi:hypothetical protein